MQRIPEPELMLTVEQSEAYARADFEAPHQRLIDLFGETFPDFDGQGTVVDLGCGPGDIALRFARRYPDVRIDAVDGSQPMIDASALILAKYGGAADRIRFLCDLLPSFAASPRAPYDVIISNSLLHHLHDSFTLWNSLPKLSRPGTRVFIKDLMRPTTPVEAQRLKERYVAGEPEVLQHDFYHSLFAAFTVEEVRADLDAAGLQTLTVEAISDRHLLVYGVMV
ncbi:MAG: methyltransferase domain-containing protein [Verrucomicrobia bacterium]|nr:methyltransferase domain-containing protein [Verrucomicrobiota bacterium]